MKLSYVVALVGAVGVGMSATVLAAGGVLSSPATTATAATPKAAPTTIRQRHTVADMMELQDGISYDDAARTLGTFGHAEGVRLAVDMGLSQGGNVAVYAWPNPDGSRIVLVFQHDRLIYRKHEGAP